MEPRDLGDLDFTKPGALPEQPVVKVEKLSNDELSPIDIQILDIVNEINKLEPLMKVPMIPSEAEKIEKAYEEAKRKKGELLDQKFRAASAPTSVTEGPIQTGDLTALRLNRDRTDSAGNPLQ